MKIIVQKFGGTSVRNKENRVQAIEKIISAKKSGYSPVVVVSAMGRKGEPYATDTLLSFAQQEINGELSPREADVLMACGEIISAVVMADSLNAAGYSAISLTGAQAGIITDGAYSNARHIASDPTRLFSCLEKGIIPVVTGFQGVTREGDVTTLGRGGSDTSACILGVMLNADMVEIYTDVDGIMTADPRLIPDARVLHDVSYAEVFQMADSGAKVIHPKAVEIAMRGNVPLVVRNTMNDTAGTRISTSSPDTENDVLVSIAHHPGRAQIKIERRKIGEENVILRSVAAAGISIDLINILTTSIIFTIEQKDTGKIIPLLDEMNVSYAVVEDCCKVSAIGSGMHGIPGVMSRIIKALVSQNIEVLQTADSHLSIACLVKEKDAQKAVAALHDEFGLTHAK